MPAPSPSTTGRLVACPRKVSTCLRPSGILDSIGDTPLVQLREASEETGCSIYGKAEHMNPGGSIKDRIAKGIVEHAERRGALRPGMTILEVTSGNTGISFAMVGAVKRYHVVVMMPKTVSEERRHMIRSFGAELQLLEELHAIEGAVEQAKAMAAKDDSLFLPRQFENADNPHTHRTTTGPEILAQTRGRFDAFVMGVGTGGTVMGVARALRDAGSRASVVAVEPEEAPLFAGKKRGGHGIQGLADGFVPPIFRLDEVHDLVRVKTGDARAMAARLAREEGLLVGISSGANVVAAKEIAKRMGPGHTIVTMLCDRGERYLSLACSSPRETL